MHSSFSWHSRAVKSVKGARKWHPYVLRVRGRLARRPAPLRTAPKLPNSQARSSLVSCWREPGGALSLWPGRPGKKASASGGLDELNALMRISENMEHVFKASWWPQCRPASGFRLQAGDFVFPFSPFSLEKVCTLVGHIQPTQTHVTCYLYMYWKKTPTYDIKNKTHSVLSVYTVYKKINLCIKHGPKEWLHYRLLQLEHGPNPSPHEKDDRCLSPS